MYICVYYVYHTAETVISSHSELEQSSVVAFEGYTSHPSVTVDEAACMQVRVRGELLIDTKLDSKVKRKSM